METLAYLLCADLWLGSNKALYMAFREFNQPTSRAPKLFATRVDIANLIEHVSCIEANNVENAQQQIIAWLLSFLCGVRQPQ